MTIRQVPGRAKPWVLDLGRVAGKRRRLFFGSLKAARKALREHQRTQKEVGDSWTRLSRKGQAEVLKLLGEIEQAGLTLRVVWETHKAAGVIPSQARSLGEVLEEMLQKKEEAGRRSIYLVQLEWICRSFSKGQEGRPVASVTTADVERFLSARNVTAWTRQTTISRLSTFFSFAIKRGYCRSNPCDRIEEVSIDPQPPRILKIEQAQALMNAAPVDTIAYLTLCLFGGVRPEEARKLEWANVDLARKIVRIDSENAKLRARRTVHLPDNAIAWLRRAGADRLMPSHSTLRRRLWALRKQVGIEWQQDILRHTAASMLLEQDRDAAAVALELGNSPEVLLRHYRELVTREEAEAFFRILPPV